ncbi:MAG: amino acid adenylation domain-containing protein [Chloroflexota bacterium]
MEFLLHKGMDVTAERFPDKPVMRYLDTQLTYAELSQRSNQLANFLEERGSQRRDRIGIFLNKSLETSIAVYGIMKSGGAFIPLDPQSPKSRLLDIIRKTGMKCVISQPDKKKILAQVAEEESPLEYVIGIDTDDDIGVPTYSWDDVAQFPDNTMPNLHLIQDDLAYILFTSGSTGAPKGMMHTHATGMSYVHMSTDLYDVRPDDVLGNHSPLHFDMSTFEYLTGPNIGTTTIVVPESYTLFPANLTQLMQDERMTFWYSVPFALIQIVLRGVLEKRDLSSFRWIMYGGEPFPPNYLAELMKHLPNAQISNVYGPAETNQVSYYTIPDPDTWVDPEANMPIGTFVPNLEGLVLDDDDSIVEDGEVGELVVRTPRMTKGYWGRPDLNARVFFRREIMPDFEEVYYRTGDLVKLRDDGLYDFLGRKDHQVKVRGYRVELLEVENAMASHDAVEEGAAYALKNDDGSDYIEVAVIVAKEATLTVDELIAHMNDRLPHYAVPSKVKFMDSFPRTGSDKVDRRGLQSIAMEEENNS